MEEHPGETQETPITKMMKNPWWVKVMPHYFILCIILDAVCDKKIGIFNLFILFVWMWMGSIIQRDKIILSKIYRICLLLLVVLDAPNVIRFIQWISALHW